MSNIVIKISTEYTKTPGGRHVKEGKFSGEDFRIKLLKPKFLEAINNNVDLVVDLDGGYGYAPSFLEEAFGGLARELKNPKILKINIISNEEPKLISDIYGYIKSALEGKK